MLRVGGWFSVGTIAFACREIKMSANNLEFKHYLSRPITRKALLITNEFSLEKVSEGEATWKYGELEFKAHQTPVVGDYIVYLNEEDIYHVDAKTFAERNEISDGEIEQEILSKGLTAPRVTPGDIESLMAQVEYQSHVIQGTTTTVVAAILPMANGSFTLAIGQSSTASKENFDADVGYKIALKNAADLARKQLWTLEGYHLKRSLENEAAAKAC